MLLTAVAWLYVVLMVAVVQATSEHGGLLDALLTLVFAGALPLGIAAYLFFSPARARARRARESAGAGSDGAGGNAAVEADRGSHPAGQPVAPVGEEP